MPKCCAEMSASVAWVATLMIDTPRSRAALMSSTVPTPGRIRQAILMLRAVSAAALISTFSSTALKP